MLLTTITHSTLKGADGKPATAQVSASAVAHFAAMGWKAAAERKVVLLEDADRVKNNPGDKTSPPESKQTTTKN